MKTLIQKLTAPVMAGLIAFTSSSVLATPVPGTLIHNIPAPPLGAALFGYSVAVSGTRMVVGAYGDDTAATDSGSVYVYDLSSGTPTVPVATLNNPSPVAGDQFGISVAISGMRVVVGANGDDTGGGNAGSVYVYDLGSATPTVPEATLNNPGPAVDDVFGFSVAISGRWVVVGAYQDDTGAIDAGSAYVYDLSSGTPTVPVVTLDNPGPAATDYFGRSVAISGTRVVVGAVFDDTSTTNAGSAYVYDMSSGTPTVPVATLNNPGPANDYFGWSVAISGTRVAVGAIWDDTGAANAGSAYVYDLSSGTPTVPVATLNNPSPAANDEFGNSVAISGTRVVVGAHGDNTGATDSGYAYAYDLAGATPTVPVATLNNPGPGANDQFGISVAIDGTAVAIGAPYDDTVATDNGYAYVFALSDTITYSPTLIAPASSAVTSSPVSVSFSLLEAALPGSVTLSFGSTVLTLATSQETAGAHAFTFNPANPTASPQVASGAAVVDGTYTVTLSYQDALGNPAATAASTGVVIDTAAPTFSLPASITAEATSAAGEIVTYTASASDAGSGVATSSFVPASGITFPIGTTTVNASATDNAGNAASGSFTVTVADTIAPTIGGTFSPLSIVAGTPLPDYTGLAVTFDAVGVTSVTQSPAAGTATVIGIIAVTLTAQDAAGHTANVSFNVTVTPVPPVTTTIASKGAAVPGAGVDARIQAGALWTTLGVPSVNDAGQVAFLGSWRAPAVTGASPLPVQNGTGIFVNGALVVKKGAAVPGITNAVMSALGEPLLGPDGSVAWTATLANAPATTGAVLSSSNTAILLDADGAGPNLAIVVARKGWIATGAAVWKAFTSVSLGDNAVAFTATLLAGTGGVTTLSDAGLWVYDRTTSTMAMALREGDPLLSSTVKVIGALAARTGSVGQGRGLANDGTQDYTVVRVTLADNRQTLGSIGQDGTGAFTRTAGGNADGYGTGAKWLSFGLPTQNTVSTAMAFLGTVKSGTGTATAANNVAIFAEDDVSYLAARIVAKGDGAGVGGGVFAALKDPVSASNQEVAFIGTMKVVPGITAADNDGIWHATTAGLTIVAREGAQPPEAPVGAQWKTFTSLALPEGGGLLFVASMHTGAGGITTANDVGLWATDSTGALRLLLQQGDAIGASTVNAFVVLSTVTGSPAQTRSFNNSGSVVVKAIDMLGAQHLLHIVVP